MNQQKKYQQTLNTAVTLTGIGLHSGKSAQITLRPARAGHGIVFVRTDLEGAPQIPALFKNVVSTQLATTLGRGKATISTVEHVLAALQGLGIDNVLIEVNGPEVPILDGSSAPFCEAISEVGIETQSTFRPVLVLRRKVEVKVGEKWAVAEPSARLEVHGSIEWDHPMIGFQEFHYIDGKTSFEEISAARTFCMLRDVEMMKKMGLALGGSLDNAVVLDNTSVLNPGGFRYADEMVRHKVLDALGDFKLAGVSIQAYVRMHRAGHELHNQLVAAIFANPDNYEIIESPEQEIRIPQIAALAHSLIAVS
ncbi:MAG: UDP-3-O-acyl-N-acetylglucosamine deacetylase [Bdellovibrionia bacterium]